MVGYVLSVSQLDTGAVKGCSGTLPTCSRSALLTPAGLLTTNHHHHHHRSTGTTSSRRVSPQKGFLYPHFRHVLQTAPHGVFRVVLYRGSGITVVPDHKCLIVAASMGTFLRFSWCSAENVQKMAALDFGRTSTGNIVNYRG